MSPLDWLILGGGIHGTYLSHVLTSRGGVPRARLRVLDPQPEPLAAFWRMTSATGMKYMRSPGVHHLGLHPYDLRRFARQAPGRAFARFQPPYERPGLALFRAHTAHTIEQNDLRQLRERGRAQALRSIQGGYRVETERGHLDARNVVLALGTSEHLNSPAWATPHPRLSHLFAPDVDLNFPLEEGPLVVVGGGISAVQFACAQALHRDVTLLVRHAPRIHRFDSDPRWLGPLGLDAFKRTDDLQERRRMIASARHRGSIPPELHADLKHRLRTGRLRWLEAEALSFAPQEDSLRLHLDRAPWSLEASRVVLATGFKTDRPGGDWLEDAVKNRELPCSPCGYPRVGPSLAWAPGLFVSGALAELELGPTARNIAGARAGGERLLRSCHRNK